MSENRRLKICYVIDNLSFRGGERVFAQLATGLDPSAYDVTVACSPGGAFVEELEANDVRVVPFNMRPQFSPLALVQLTMFLRQEKPDIVHCQGRGDPYGRIAATWAGVPIILSTTAMIASRYWVDSAIRKRIYRAIDRYTGPMVDHWLVLNQLSIDVLVRDHHVDPKAITLIPNGIEVDRYAADRTDAHRLRRELGIDDSTPLIGAIGSLTVQKGFDVLLNAMPAVLAEHPDAHLVIAGDGELQADLEAHIQGLGLSQHCHLLGFRSDVPDLLAALDLYALSSVIEGMPMVLLEAMAAGRPAVSTCIPGANDLIEDGVDGLLVDPGDSTALAKGINKLLADQEFASRLGTTGQNKVSKQYTVDVMVARTAALYHELYVGTPLAAGRPTADMEGN